MAVGRTKKITRAQAGAYEKLTPNGRGVTAIASVNGRGAYAQHYAATKAILAGRKKAPKTKSALSSLSGKIANRRASVAKKMAAAGDAFRKTGRTMSQVMKRARRVAASAAKKVLAKPVVSSKRGHAVARTPSQSKATKSVRAITARSLVSPAPAASRRVKSQSARVYEENMRHHRPRARANARRHYGYHRNGLADALSRARAAASAGPAPATVVVTTPAPKRGRGRPRLSAEVRAARDAEKARKAAEKRAAREAKKAARQAAPSVVVHVEAPSASPAKARRKKAAKKVAKKARKAAVAPKAPRKVARKAPRKPKAAKKPHGPKSWWGARMPKDKVEARMASILSPYSVAEDKIMKRARSAARRGRKASQGMFKRTLDRVRFNMGLYQPTTSKHPKLGTISRAIDALESKGMKYLVNPRRRHGRKRKHGLAYYEANRKSHKARRHYSRNGELVDGLKSALKTGLFVGAGFFALKALTAVVDQFVLDKFEATKALGYKKSLAAGAVALVGVPGMAFTKKFLSQEQRTSIQAGMIVGLLQSVVVNVIAEQLEAPTAVKTLPYFQGYPEQYRGTGEYLATNGVGEYLATNGYGEYLATNGYGEYLATNGMGAAEFQQAAAGYGQLTQAAAGYGAGPIQQAAAGYGEFTQAAAGFGAGIYDGILPNTQSAEYALSVAEATAGIGDVDEVSTVNPTDMALSIDGDIQELRSGILEGGDGIFG